MSHGEEHHAEAYALLICIQRQEGCDCWPDFAMMTREVEGENTPGLEIVVSHDQWCRIASVIERRN